MTRPHAYLIDYPSTAQVVLPMENLYDNVSTIEYDMSLGDGHDATKTNMTNSDLTINVGEGRWVRSRPFGSGFEFDGSATDMTNAGHLLHNIPALSIIAWFVPADVTNNFQAIMSAYVGNNDRVELLLGADGDDLEFRVGTGAGSILAEITGLVNDHLYFAAAVWDKDDNSGKATLYLYDYDTKTLSTNTEGVGYESPTTANDDLWVGARDGGSVFWQGVLCRVQLYNFDKLTSTQVEDLYLFKKTVIDTGNTVRIWEMKAQHGTMAYGNTAAADGKYGRAQKFIGADDHLLVADHADLEIGANDFTIACRAYSSDLSGDDSYILFKNAALSLNVDTNGNIEFIMTGVGTDTSTTTGTPFTEDTWHSVVVKRTSNVLTIWVDGVSETLDSATQNETMADNGNDWLIGGDGTTTMEKMGLFIFDPSVAYSDQWIKDFHTGLPAVPVFTDPVDGASSIGFSILDDSGEYETRLDHVNMYTTQLVCWMGDAEKGLYPFFWRGYLWESTKTHRPRGVNVLFKDWSDIQERTFDGTYGETEGTTPMQDLYTTLNAVKASEISLTHTSNPTGVAIIYEIARGTPIQDVFRMAYTDLNTPGFVDPWRDHWITGRTTLPHDPDGWTDTGATAAHWNNTTGTTSDIGIRGLFNGNAIVGSDAIGGTWDAYINQSLDLMNWQYIEFWCQSSLGDPTTYDDTSIRLRMGAGNYYDFAFRPPTTGGGDEWQHVILKLPDHNNTYGWTTTGTPDQSAVDRVWFYCTGGGNNGAIDIDGLHLVSFSDKFPGAELTDAHVISGGVGTSIRNYANAAVAHYDGGPSESTSFATPVIPGEVILAIPTLTTGEAAFSTLYEGIASRIAVYTSFGTLPVSWDNLILWMRRSDSVHVTSTNMDLDHTDQFYISAMTVSPRDGITFTLNPNKLMNAPRASAPQPVIPGLPLVAPLPAASIALFGGRAFTPAVAAAFGLRRVPSSDVPLAGVAQAGQEYIWRLFFDDDREARKWRTRYHD